MTEPTSPRRGRTPTIDREQIVAAALRLLDSDGLDALSTRRLALELGVRSPTLYWHVRNKAELLDLVAEAICADAFDIDDSAPWRDQLAGGLHQFRAMLLRHRDAAAVLRARPPLGPHRLGHVETTVRILVEAGFDDRDVAGIARLLSTHVLDSVPAVRDEPAPGADPVAPDVSGHPHLRRLWPEMASMTDEERFDLGVEILLDGLERRRR